LEGFVQRARATNLLRLHIHRIGIIDALTLQTTLKTAWKNSE